jgi:Domain of unknown function (DUF1127)
MTQMSHNVIAFQNAHPVNEREQAARRLSHSLGRAETANDAGFGGPGLLAGLVAGIKRYLAHRRTIKALDGLNNEQLKDIGYRRIPDGYSKYEPLP